MSVIQPQCRLQKLLANQSGAEGDAGADAGILNPRIKQTPSLLADQPRAGGAGADAGTVLGEARALGAPDGAGP